MSEDRDINYKIVEELGVLSTSSKGWTKELNLISWNGRPAKYDIRDWAPDREKMGKGITLSEEELANLMELAPHNGSTSQIRSGMTLDELVDQWDEIVEAAPIAIREYLSQSHPNAINGNIMLINVKKGKAYDALTNKDNSVKLDSYINSLLDQNVKVEINESAWI